VLSVMLCGLGVVLYFLWTPLHECTVNSVLLSTTWRENQYYKVWPRNSWRKNVEKVYFSICFPGYVCAWFLFHSQPDLHFLHMVQVNIAGKIIV
jgi:hypothetical protein